jgi:2-keto-4-pentenoate hydratase/2-oxohepta-3-ene-1,7-dioic acid hydratase in catechol pathway
VDLRLATYERSGVQRVGAVLDDLRTLVDLGAADGRPAFSSMQALIEGGDAALGAAREIVARPPRAALVPLSDVRLLAPVPVPMQIRDFLVSEKLFRQARAANLRVRSRSAPDPEAAFRNGLAAGVCEPPPVWYEQPIYFKGNRFSVVGTEADVRWPAYCELFDYELEMGMFIGRGGRDIGRDDARSHIFGYTVFNDMSARDAMMREMPVGLGPAKGKDFDTGNVIGPWIVTADEIPDPYSLEMSVRVNGELQGRGTLAEMHHKFEDMIVHVSRSETIYPGEFFGSGTIGDGSGQEHDRYLQPGDVIEMEIDSIGVLRNRVVR